MSSNTYTMRLSDFEKEQYRDFGRKHGCNSLKKLFIRSVEAVMRNPDVLDPTTTDSKEFYERFRELQAERKGTMELLVTAIEELREKQNNMSRKVDFLVKKNNPTKKELKAIDSRDKGADEIFR